MRLAALMLENLEPLCREWEDSARSIRPHSRSPEPVDLRDRMKEILQEIAAAVAGSTPIANATGEGSAVHAHAEARLKSGFDVEHLVAEYCALRASVLRLRLSQGKNADRHDLDDMRRFDEAVDRILAEAVAHYASLVRRSRDIFLGMVGHDLRTPLQSLSIGAQLLLQLAQDDSRLSQLGTRMLNSASRMSQILDNLLDFTRSRLGSGMRIKLRPADLAAILEQVVEELRLSHPERAIVVQSRGDLSGRWDAGRIGQVCQNLIGNALQHGGREGDITVRAQGDENGVRIDVHNYGEPIPEAEQARIFDPMHRYVNQAAGRSDWTSLGLGLYIVREIVQAHKGSVEVRSAVGSGTTFSVWLPKKDAP